MNVKLLVLIIGLCAAVSLGVIAVKYHAVSHLFTEHDVSAHPEDDPDHNHTGAEFPTSGPDQNQVHDHAGSESPAPSLEEHTHDGPEARLLDPEEIRLDESQMKKFDIRLGPVTPGRLDLTVTVPGDVKLNADNVAHIVPLVPGIVRRVFK